MLSSSGLEYPSEIQIKFRQIFGNIRTLPHESLKIKFDKILNNEIYTYFKHNMFWQIRWLISQGPSPGFEPDIPPKCTKCLQVCSESLTCGCLNEARRHFLQTTTFCILEQSNSPARKLKITQNPSSWPRLSSRESSWRAPMN